MSGQCIVSMPTLPEGWLISSWPEVEGDEFYSSGSLLVQFTSLTDYAECLKLMTFVVFLFRVIKDCLRKRTLACMQSSTTWVSNFYQPRRSMRMWWQRVAPSYSTWRPGLLNSNVVQTRTRTWSWQIEEEHNGPSPQSCLSPRNLFMQLSTTNSRWPRSLLAGSWTSSDLMSAQHIRGEISTAVHTMDETWVQHFQPEMKNNWNSRNTQSFPWKADW